MGNADAARNDTENIDDSFRDIDLDNETQDDDLGPTANLDGLVWFLCLMAYQPL